MCINVATLQELGSKSALQFSFKLFLERLNRRNRFYNPDPQVVSAIEVCRNANRLISEFHFALTAGNYTLQPARVVIIPEGSRELYKFNILDSFVLFHVAQYLNQRISAVSPANVYSYRKGFGQHRALREASQFIARSAGPIFYYRFDIRKFGENISHRAVLDRCRERFATDEALLKFIQALMRFPYESAGRSCQRICGLPAGHFLTSVGSNIVLVEIDLEMDKYSDSVKYFRYGDDILLMSCDRESLTEKADFIFKELACIDAVPHPAKTFPGMLVKPHEVCHWKQLTESTTKVGSFLEYLGYRITFKGTITPNREKIRHMHRTFRRRLKSAARMLDDTSLASVLGLMNRIARESSSLNLDSVKLPLMRSTDPDFIRGFNHSCAQYAKQLAVSGRRARPKDSRSTQPSLEWNISKAFFN